MVVRVSVSLVLLLIAGGCARHTEPAPEQPAQPVPAAVVAPESGSPARPSAEAEAAARLASVPLGDKQAAASDGYPSGDSTAEGVACDLVRAFINADSALFRKTCMPASFVKGDEYKSFLDELSSQMDQIQAGTASNAGGPTKIHRVYKVRNLSRNGPGSAGYAINNLHGVKFVDVEAPLTDGTMYTNRTLVFQFEDKTWRVMPRPDLVPMLSTGLNQESDSTEELKPSKP